MAALRKRMYAVESSTVPRSHKLIQWVVSNPVNPPGPRTLRRRFLDVGKVLNLRLLHVRVGPVNDAPGAGDSSSVAASGTAIGVLHRSVPRLLHIATLLTSALSEDAAWLSRCRVIAKDAEVAGVENERHEDGFSGMGAGRSGCSARMCIRATIRLALSAVE